MNSVGSKSAFQRSFFIFTNEDTGFEAGQKPSGHVKVEVRGARGKLHAVAQNLRPGNGRFDYILYILRSGDNAVEPIRAGRMENKLSRWELEWTFDPDKLGIPGYPADDCDIVAILAEFADRQGGKVICPLAAYKNKPVEWRSRFRQTEPPTETLSVVYLNEPEAGYEEEDAAAIKENTFEKGDDDSASRQMDSASVKAEDKNEGINAGTNEGIVVAANEMETEGEDSNNYVIDAGAASKSSASTNTIDTTCIYLNGNMCAALIQPEAGGANPCGSCKLSHREQTANARLPVDMMRLEEIFDKNFERSDPFESNRSDYSWWKVTNPVNLNNILYLNSIRSPLLFNPAVMVAHYKYRHFIIGIFTHMDGQKYVVCGVPGMHMVDRKPFGQLGTWVQTEGNKLRYGAFGYWLVYINTDDGKMLNLNQNAGF